MLYLSQSPGTGQNNNTWGKASYLVRGRYLLPAADIAHDKTANMVFLFIILPK
jgi:hypothetical protein